MWKKNDERFVPCDACILIRIEDRGRLLQVIYLRTPNSPKTTLVSASYASVSHTRHARTRTHTYIYVARNTTQPRTGQLHRRFVSASKICTHRFKSTGCQRGRRRMVRSGARLGETTPRLINPPSVATEGRFQRRQRQRDNAHSTMGCTHTSDGTHWMLALVIRTHYSPRTSERKDDAR